MAKGTHGQADPVRQLERLMALEYDADEAYQAAIDHFADPRYSNEVTALKADHRRHLDQLELLVRRQGGTPPRAPDLRGRLEHGKLLIAQLGGDDAILRALRSNAEHVAAAYEQALAGAPAEVREILIQGRDDAWRHRDWFDTAVRTLESAPHRGVPPWNIPPPSGF